MEEYVQFRIDVFDTSGNQAKVRKNLTVSALVDEVLREFDDLDRKTPEAYAVYLKGQTKPLDRDKTIEQLDLQPGDELEFRYARRLQRGFISAQSKAYVREERSRALFQITWQPALLGRTDVDPAYNELLAVNLEAFPDGQRVSRRHAQITSDKDEFFLEGLSPNNPTYLNDHPITGRSKLNNGDRIRLGKSQIVLTFVQE